LNEASYRIGEIVVPVVLELEAVNGDDQTGFRPGRPTGEEESKQGGMN
jgi:hypothetical protein